MKAPHLPFSCKFNDYETLASYADGRYDYYDVERIEDFFSFKGAYEIESLFEKYYAAKLKKLEQEKRKRSHNISREISHKQIDVNNNISNEDEKANPNIHGIRPVKKEHNKIPLPKPNEGSLILPKINHNYLYENRKIISEGKVPKKYHIKEDNKPQYHKDFGRLYKNHNLIRHH